MAAVDVAAAHELDVVFLYRSLIVTWRALRGHIYRRKLIFTAEKVKEKQQQQDERAREKNQLMFYHWTSRKAERKTIHRVSNEHSTHKKLGNTSELRERDR